MAWNLVQWTVQYLSFKFNILIFFIIFRIIAKQSVLIEFKILFWFFLKKFNLYCQYVWALVNIFNLNLCRFFHIRLIVFCLFFLFSYLSFLELYFMCRIFLLIFCSSIVINFLFPLFYFSVNFFWYFLCKENRQSIPLFLSFSFTILASCSSIATKIFSQKYFNPKTYWFCPHCCLFDILRKEKIICAELFSQSFF